MVRNLRSEEYTREVRCAERTHVLVLGKNRCQSQVGGKGRRSALSSADLSFGLDDGYDATAVSLRVADIVARVSSWQTPGRPSARRGRSSWRGRKSLGGYAISTCPPCSGGG